jgi:hypothetical protein
MVSEGDLIGRREVERESRRDWWLALLAEGNELNPEFIASLRTPERTARDVMAAPVVTVAEDAEVSEVARLLAAYRIKRVPVVRDDRIVGIVSRADLLRALSQDEAPSRTKSTAAAGLFANVVGGIDERFLRRNAMQAQPVAPSVPVDTGLTVYDFQKLVVDFEQKEHEHAAEARRAAAAQRKQQVAEFINQHVSDAGWRSLLHRAREAAEHGQRGFMLLRFPSQLCSDGGRAINITEAGWPMTLRGEAAELYLRWERDLKPQGFRLAARVLDFPGGMPGDVGLFLTWGE